MAKNIDAKLHSISAMFSNSHDSILGKERTFIIPEYQRAYNWRYNEQCDKLWQDIESFIDHTSKGGNDTYFFGSIIINNDNDKLYLIDGQQRITTFILLLKALLVRINELIPEISDDEDSISLKEGLELRRRKIISCLYSIDEDEIHSIIKGNKKVEKEHVKYLNNSINEEYRDEVEKILLATTYADTEKNTTPISNKRKDNKYTNYFRNFKFFYEKLQEPKINPTIVNNFAKKLLETCQVIVVISYQTDEAIEIFNSLNSTGMPLTDADIISAKLYSTYNRTHKSFNENWMNIIENVNKLSADKITTIDEILNQYMYILRAANREMNTTLPSVRKYFTKDNEVSLKEPDRFISDLDKIISIWNNENISDEILQLRYILLKLNNNFKFFYITFLYFYLNESDEIKTRFTEDLVKLFAIMSITGYAYSSSEFKIFLIKQNMLMREEGKTVEDVLSKFNEHINKFNKDDITKIIVNSNPNNGIIYLNEYLYAKETNTPISLDIPKIEIEHIMPSSGKNIDAIREDASMDEDEFKQYVNKLGNKILLEKSINGRLSNDWFKVKKQKSIQEKRGYKDSQFPIAQKLTEYPKDSWGKEDIEIATKKAAERIVNFLFS